MSGARAASDALLAAAAEAGRPVRAAIDHYRSAISTLIATDDLTAVMQRTGTLILAAEALEAATKAMGQRLRSVLAEQMVEAGAVGIRLDAHVLGTREMPPSVIITDEKAIPQKYWTAPEPHPDRALLSKLLRQGQKIPGAVLGNAGRAVLEFRRAERKEMTE